MKNLKESFEGVYEKYKQKREKFRVVIDGWNKRRSSYHEAFELLKATDIMAESLIKDFATSTASNQSELKSRVKIFKNNYKKLNEITKPILQQWLEAVVVAVVLAVILRNLFFGLYHVPTGSAEHTILVGDRIWGNKMAYYLDEPKRGDCVIFDDPLFKFERYSQLKLLWQKYVGFPIPLLGLGAGPDNWVKRVIAVPGDTIEGRVEDGKTTIYLNGKKIDEPYVNKYPLIRARRSKGVIPFETIGPLRVPEFLHLSERDNYYYTYDTGKTINEQVFYRLTPSEIVQDPLTGKPNYLEPYSPTYNFDYDERKFYCVDAFGPFKIPEGKYWMMGDSRKNSKDSRIWGFLDRSLIHGRASFIIYSIDSEEAFWFFDFIKHPIDFWFKKVRWDRMFNDLSKYNGKIPYTPEN